MNYWSRDYYKPWPASEDYATTYREPDYYDDLEVKRKIEERDDEAPNTDTDATNNRSGGERCEENDNGCGNERGSCSRPCDGL